MNLERARAFMWFGIIAMLNALAWIVTAIITNPSFDFYKDALSQLGSPGSNFTWIYNYGLISTSLLLFLFACSLLFLSKNKIESAGSAFLMMAALFLALIGIYHGGTYPHDFVSLWFFIIADIAIFTWGLGLVLHDRKWGVYILFLGLIASVLAFTLPWQSSAELETFGTAGIALWAIFLTYLFRNKYAS